MCGKTVVILLWAMWSVMFATIYVVELVRLADEGASDRVGEPYEVTITG